MYAASGIGVAGIILSVVITGVFVFLLVLVICALRKYLRTGDVRSEKAVVRKSLGEAIRAHRAAHKMTQEFVAEALGVSRQAVSKWEMGSSDPSTSNLFALSKLFGISVEELLREVQEEDENQ